MKMRINQKRTFKADVTVIFHDDDGVQQKGKMGATYKVIPLDEMKADENTDKTLLDLVLVGVHDIDLVDENGDVLTGDALLQACKHDPSIGSALVRTYSDKTGKKNSR